jgi:hypothetical protein
MTLETVSGPQAAEPKYLQWTPVIAGALAATALSLILITFAAAVGLGVSSTAPSWRDASAAMWILSGIYLILQAIVSFGFGAYIAGRLTTSCRWSCRRSGKSRRTSWSRGLGAGGGSWFNGSCICWRCDSQPTCASIGKRQADRAYTNISRCYPVFATVRQR